MTSHHFINRHQSNRYVKHHLPKHTHAPLRAPTYPPQNQKSYIICSPEGCAIIKNPKQTPPNTLVYLTPDYTSDTEDSDIDPHTNLAI